MENELDVMIARRPEVTTPSLGDLARARETLVTAITHDAAAPPTLGGRDRASWHRLRILRYGVAALVLAFVVSATALVVTHTNRQPPTVPPRVNVAAEQFFRGAATSVAHGATTTPQPNQFIFGETEEPDGIVTETWLSVDGSTSGETRVLSAEGQVVSDHSQGPPCSLDQYAATGCFPTVGYFATLPTSPLDMVSYLNATGITDTNGSDASLPGWTANQLGNAVDFLLTQTYLDPAQQAALYETMALTPGFVKVPSLESAIGASGVGIEWSMNGDTTALIFNPTTYAYLGIRTWAGAPAVNAPYQGDALVNVAIVNGPGELPGT